MSQSLAPVFGALVCCGVPLFSFMAGMMYARYGSPIAVRFGWRRRPELALDED